MLMAKFSELKERKQRVDRITEMLLTLKNEEELDNSGGGGGVNRAPPTLPPSEAAGRGGATAQESSSNNVARQVGKSELVAGQEDDDVGPNMALLQEKLRCLLCVCVCVCVCICGCMVGFLYFPC